MEDGKIIPVARTPVAKNLERRRLWIERKVSTANGGPLQGFHSIRGQFSLFGCLTAKLDAEPDFRQCTESAQEVNFVKPVLIIPNGGIVSDTSRS
jgi:hypothetical protein